MNKFLTTMIVGLCFSMVGCAARSAEMYRDDTRKLLDGKKAEIKDCYDDVLKKDGKAGGKVVVRFTVKSDSGKIENAKVNKAQSTGSKALGKCIVKAIEGLKLDPADERDGDATFTWEFEAKG